MVIKYWPFDTEFEPQVGDQVKLIYSQVRWALIFDFKSGSPYDDPNKKYKRGDLKLGETYTVLKTHFVYDGIYAWQIQVQGSRGPIWGYAIHFTKESNSLKFIMK